MVAIYDACRSGSFISQMTGPDLPDRSRVVIASTGPDQVAYFLDTAHSFSAHFWNTFSGKAGNKANMSDAYTRAAEMMAPYQRAQFDADGNGVANEPEDFSTLASIEGNIYALRRQYMNQALTMPVIDTITVGSLSGPGTTARLQAEDVYDLDGDGINRVWVEIVPPDYNPDSAGLTVKKDSLPGIDPLPGPDGNGVYVQDYSEFTVKGTSS